MKGRNWIHTLYSEQKLTHMIRLTSGKEDMIIIWGDFCIVYSTVHAELHISSVNSQGEIAASHSGLGTE